MNAVIIPTYNEKGTIGILLNELTALYPDLYIFVVDDHSPDGTQDVVKDFMTKYSQIELFTREQKTGLGDAYKFAFKKLLAEYPEIKNFVTMDADGSHNPLVIKDFLEAMKNNDLAVGSRYMEGNTKGIVAWNFRRRMLSRGANLYSQFFTRVPIADLTSGYICIRRTLLEKMDLSKISSTGYSYQIEFKCQAIRQAHGSYREMPITFYPRRAGVSKMTGKIILEGIIAPLRIFFRAK
ncbi:MAG: glycosyl transferase, group 2 family protein [Candidatus Paceibacter sp.]|jgi:dolichol-phosphate mannosyltransferase|nr:glycosyl transferase, group 2 family protein [Candidatus Paceibacter sp.]